MTKDAQNTLTPSRGHYLVLFPPPHPRLAFQLLQHKREQKTVLGFFPVVHVPTSYLCSHSNPKTFTFAQLDLTDSHFRLLASSLSGTNRSVCHHNCYC